MISFFHMELLEQIEARILEHESAGREIHWLGGGSDALSLPRLPRDQALAAVFKPTAGLRRTGGRSAGTVAGVSLLFAPPFDLVSIRASNKLESTRAAHIAAARVALRHLEGWTSVDDGARGPVRPGGLIYALCVAEGSFILEMLVFGWAIAADGQWGLVDGWSIASQIPAAEGIYAAELEQRLARQAIRLVWLGPATARLKPMLWPDTSARPSISRIDALEPSRGAK